MLGSNGVNGLTQYYQRVNSLNSQITDPGSIRERRLTADNRNLASENNRLENSNRQLESRNDRLESRNRSLNRDLDQLENQIDDLNRQLRTSETAPNEQSVSAARRSEGSSQRNEVTVEPQSRAMRAQQPETPEAGSIINTFA